MICFEGFEDCLYLDEFLTGGLGGRVRGLEWLRSFFCALLRLVLASI